MNTISTNESRIADFAERFINQTNKSIFLTGKAGTGKTTLLKHIVASTHKRCVICAPTGIAALNAGGVTIHSLFQLPFGGFLPIHHPEPQFAGNIKLETRDSIRKHFFFNGMRKKLLLSVELLIVDEVSMLRADILDAMDWALRNVRKNPEPFGGVQVLFIGDLLQLPPVVKQEEWNLLSAHYSSPFFFDAHCIRHIPPLFLELDKIYRQDDEVFIGLLNRLRNNRISPSDLETLQPYVNPSFKPGPEEQVITIVTHNAQADRMNQEALDRLKEKPVKYTAEIAGDFPRNLFPIDEELVLKVGAQIMFIKNDVSYEKNFFNGKMGIIESCSKEEIMVHFPEEKRSISVEKYEWENIKYELNPATNEIEGKTIGTFVHYPIKLAWAITVHKSQGLTFDRAVLDLGAVFAPGQAYVAFSRLRSLKGLTLLRPLSLNGLSNDSSVMNYTSNEKQRNAATDFQQSLQQETINYLRNRLVHFFDWFEYQHKWDRFQMEVQGSAQKTEKAKDKEWAMAQWKQVSETYEHSKKFKGQLENLFQQTNLSVAFIHERFSKAMEYFFPILDRQVEWILRRKIELIKIKRTKSYIEELEELLEFMVNMVQEFKKLSALTEAFALEKEWSKSLFDNDQIARYLIAKNAKIQQELRSSKSSLLDLDDEEEESDVPKALRYLLDKKDPKKGPKEKKQSTYEITLDLFERGMDIKAIAQERQLSAQTVEGHFAQLIKAEQIELDQIISAERIAFLKEKVFNGYEGGSLSPLKEHYDKEVTWAELKWYQAYLLR